MGVEQATKSLTDRINESLEKVQRLRTTGREMSLRLATANDLLQERGRQFPKELPEEYAAWSDECEAVIAEWSDETRFHDYLPSPSDFCTDLADWEEALTRCHDDLEAAETERRQTRQRRQTLLERVLDLHCVGGESPGLVEIQKRAVQLQAALSVDACESDTSEANKETKQYLLFDALWRLAHDAHDDGTINESSSVEWGELLRQEFGMQLVMRVYQGKIVPRSGWPAEEPEAHESNGDARVATDAPIAVPSLIPPPRPDVVNSEEALSRLKWAQESNHEPPELHNLPTSPPPIDIRTLKSIHSRVRSDCDRALNEAGENGDVTQSELADCFAALDAAMGYVISVAESRQQYKKQKLAEQWAAAFPGSLQRMATAQSALRKFHLNQGWGDCPEQIDTFDWLKQVTDEQDVYISKHMTLDAPADPAQAVALKQGTEEARRKWERPKRLGKLTSKIKYEIAQMNGDPATDRSRWETIVVAVDQLIEQDAVKPSKPFLRDALLPKYDQFPDDLETSQSFQLVLQAIDEYEANHEAEEAKQAQTRGEPHRSPQVDEVTKLLRGKKLVMVGGESREETRQRLEQAFELSEFEWIGAREHESKEKYQHILTRPDVFIVCLLVRLCGHDHIDNLKDVCRDAGKHCVLMPRGYSVDRIAHDIVDQCGNRLREESDS